MSSGVRRSRVEAIQAPNMFQCFHQVSKHVAETCLPLSHHYNKDLKLRTVIFGESGYLHCITQRNQ